MYENLYFLTDKAIVERMGKKIQEVRLRQNITQQKLAVDAGTSLSTVQKIERGEIGSIMSYIQILRVLRMLDSLYSLIEEEKLSPSQILEAQENAAKYKRKHASKK